MKKKAGWKLKVTCSQVFGYAVATGLSESDPTNAVLRALRRMGYGKEEMTGHGFRAMAKTVMLEVLKMPDQYIELPQAHLKGS